MTPEEFLQEEFRNVKLALLETLRYDYGPDLTHGYYEECAARLDRIEREVPRTKHSEVWVRLYELSRLAEWISLIERSRLGEFSWPFAEQIREIAKPLLVEKSLSGVDIEPIIHVIAEGDGYQIVYESISPSVKCRFAIVAFPRPLKHHVLLHTIFGHELGHTAQSTTAAGALLRLNVRDALSASGALSSVSKLTSWIHHANAPPGVKNDLASWLQDEGSNYTFQEYHRQSWLDELICDLFGLLLFGPAFAAAHKTLLLPTHPTPYHIPLYDPTHPPYAIRHKLLVRAMRFMKWDKPIVPKTRKNLCNAEMETLKHITHDPYPPWTSFFDDNQLEEAILGIRNVLSTHGGFEYERPDAEVVEGLVGQLTRRIPPIIAQIDENGLPKLKRTAMPHVLYAGWIYWLGRAHLKVTEPLSFFNVNRLCDHALLQECGIHIVTA